jgi:hypothetical protein
METLPAAPSVKVPASKPRRKQGRPDQALVADPLKAFSERFLARSWREFNACPLVVKQSSQIVADSYGKVSVCDKDRDYTLIHYRDTVEETLKSASTHGDVTPEPLWILKGAIFSTATATSSSTCEMVCRGFPYTPVRVVGEQELIRVFDRLDSRPFIRLWLEGTVVRVWTDAAGTVRISSTRRIDATRSKKDSCPSTEEMLIAAKVDVKTLQAGTRNIPLGTVFVLLVVHPMNQVQNPDRVDPAAYLLDTWVLSSPPSGTSGAVPSGGAGTSSGTVPAGGAGTPTAAPGKRAATPPAATAATKVRAADPVQRFRRLPHSGPQYSAIQRLPLLSTEEALKAYRNGQSVYIQRTAEYGVVYRSLALGTRYAIRGDREHPYHRFVELGGDRKLLDCVAHAHLNQVKAFPERFNQEVESLLAFGEGLFLPGAHLPATESSLYAWYASAKQLSSGTPRERLRYLLNACPKLVVYNMLSTYRNKYKRRGESDLTSSGGGDDTSSSSPSSRCQSPTLLPPPPAAAEEVVEA